MAARTGRAALRARWVPCALGLSMLGVLGACGSGEDGEDGEDGDGGSELPLDCGASSGERAPADALPPLGSRFDYQLGGAYAVADGVNVVVRDSAAEPAPGVYSVCYINGFQTQPDADWSGARADLVLRDAGGDPVADPDWPDEALLDISTPRKRERLAEIVGGWLAGCAAGGFDAAEFDNLDSYTRSSGALTYEHASQFARALTAAAHRSGLAAAQKNAADAARCRSALGFDFAITEQCWEYDECDTFTAEYGERVFDIEYDPDAFAAGCSARRTPAPLLRDRALAPPGPGHVRAVCP